MERGRWRLRQVRPTEPGQWVALGRNGSGNRFIGKTVVRQGVLRVRGVMDYRGVRLPNDRFPDSPPAHFRIHGDEFVVSEEEGIRQLLAGV